MCIVVKLLTKPGCTLCERSVFLLKRLKIRYPMLQLSKCDIMRLPQYHQYALDLPVVLINEQPVCKLKIR